MSDADREATQADAVRQPEADDSAAAAATDAPPARTSARSARRTGPDYWFNRLQTPVTLVTALTALILSLLTWRELHATPEVSVTLPARLRIAQQPDEMWVYLQPTFVTTQSSDVPAVVSAARLELTAPSGGESLSLEWDENGAFVYDAASNRANYRYVGDPTPFVVTAQSPEMPTMLFSGKGRLGLGLWDAQLVMDPGQEDESTSDFCLEVSQTDVENFEFSDVSEAGVAGYYLFVRPAGDDDACFEAKS